MQRELRLVHITAAGLPLSFFCLTELEKKPDIERMYRASRNIEPGVTLTIAVLGSSTMNITNYDVDTLKTTKFLTESKAYSNKDIIGAAKRALGIRG